MAEQLWNDLAALALDGAINNSQTSITVSSALAVSANFRIIIDSELMLVTAVASTTWTVTRGAESTTAASHADLATIHIIATAGGLNQWLSDAVSLGLQVAIARTALLP